MSKPYNYEEAKRLLKTGLNDMRILSGDIVGPSDASWQDVAATAAINFTVLASRLEAARYGNVTGPTVFPSPDDLEDE